MAWLITFAKLLSVVLPWKSITSCCVPVGAKSAIRSFPNAELNTKVSAPAPPIKRAPEVLVSLSGALVPTIAEPLLALSFPALSVSTAVNVRADELARKVQLQVPFAPTVALPAVPDCVDIVTLAPASPVPVSFVEVPPVKTGAMGATVSIVTDNAFEAALMLPATSVALAVMLWVPFARAEEE